MKKQSGGSGTVERNIFLKLPPNDPLPGWLWGTKPIPGSSGVGITFFSGILAHYEYRSEGQSTNEVPGLLDHRPLTGLPIFKLDMFDEGCSTMGIG
jgi:hypothetical protein